MSAHITEDSIQEMDSTAAILVDHATNEDMGEMTEDDNIGLLLYTDLMCFHFHATYKNFNDLDADELMV